MRKLKNFAWNITIGIGECDDSAYSKSEFVPSDLMLSVLVDKRLNSTEKAIIGLFIEESLIRTQSYNMGDGELNEQLCFPSSVNVCEDSCVVIADYLTTKEISKILEISMPTVFNNISSLKDKGIISFDRYKFGEYAKIGFNIGYLALIYFE